MLRWGLLGGTWPPAPWELFITLGGALLGTSVLFVFLYPLWSTLPLPGILETGGFLTAAAVLLTVGLVRRARSMKKP